MHKISLDERIQGSIWGQFVGDAASLATHFLEAKELEKRFPKGVQGFEAPNSGHIYAKKKSGESTLYGDAALVMLKSIEIQKGFSARTFGTLFLETFASPSYPCALDETTRETIENYHISLEDSHPDMGFEFQGGANNTDLDTATRLAPLIAVYWEAPNLLAIVDKATRVTQNNEITVAYMRSYARILQNLLEGQDLEKTIRKETQHQPDDTPLDHHVREKISQALKQQTADVKSATLKFGAGSTLDESFPSAIHAALKHSDSFKEAILETVKAGGDTAGRAAIVGTILGAHLGLDAIPKEWMHKLSHHKDIDEAIHHLPKLQSKLAF